MTGREIDWVLAALRSGNFRVTYHAAERMFERSIQKRDLMEAGETVTDCYQQANGKYCVEGFTTDRELIQVICAYDGETVIITVIGKD